MADQIWKYEKSGCEVIYTDTDSIMLLRDKNPQFKHPVKFGTSYNYFKVCNAFLYN
mgnify:CR=1 FL=1